MAGLLLMGKIRVAKKRVATKGAAKMSTRVLRTIWVVTAITDGVDHNQIERVTTISAPLRWEWEAKRWEGREADVDKRRSNGGWRGAALWQRRTTGRLCRMPRLIPGVSKLAVRNAQSL